jgi:hypothetical protein
MSLATDLSDGIGGLKFVATAPPGVGRLVRIPFYLQNATASFAALQPGSTAAASTGSAVSPAVLAASQAAGSSECVIMRTPQISWATLRIVGFECAINTAVVPVAAQPEIMFSDLKIGGGANLFVHEDFASSRIYLAGQDSFSGLRDYPLLKSPNVAEVTVALFAGAAAAGAPTAALTEAASFSCNLVCEILQDDNYGSHVPGPYARKGAMVRRGGSFI